MKAEDLKKIVHAFKWRLLHRMYGCAHSSIIGFISREWLNQSENHSILDGAPSPIIGGSRIGQKNSDVLLCDGNTPLIVVEVETGVKAYPEKLKTIISYLHNEEQYAGLNVGFLFMTNLCTGNNKYKHNWHEIKESIKGKDHNIILISIEKEKSNIDTASVLGSLRKRNEYYPWEIVRVDYWIHDEYSNIEEGNLWKKPKK